MRSKLPQRENECVCSKAKSILCEKYYIYFREITLKIEFLSVLTMSDLASRLTCTTLSSVAAIFDANMEVSVVIQGRCDNI
jgi:hypothetical protein